MKKALVILLFCCYALCSFGISFSFHHCKGHLKYLTLVDEKTKKCCKGKKKMSKGCCKDKKVSFKKTDDKGQHYFTIAKKTLPVFNISYVWVDPVFNSNNEVDHLYYRIHPPPERRDDQPIYLLYAVFRV